MNDFFNGMNTHMAKYIVESRIKMLYSPRPLYMFRIEPPTLNAFTAGMMARTQSKIWKVIMGTQNA